MKILIVGNGAREHAYVWKSAQNPNVTEVFVAPGNAGTALEPKVKNVDIPVTDIKRLTQFAWSNRIDLTIVGPEQPLELGIVDAFQEAGLKCFGPTKAAAQLETSKVYAKKLMREVNIPTGNFGIFTQYTKVQQYIGAFKPPIVVKPDGLTGGKGVVIAKTTEEALRVAYLYLFDRKYGDACNSIILEQFIEGPEVSFICFVDGHTVLPLSTSQDHKMRDENNMGPMTGGMGAYTPVSFMTPELERKIVWEIFFPVMNEMYNGGTPYKGLLYAGLKIASDGTPYVLEFNARGGDPEMEPLMMRMQSDFVDLCFATINGELADKTIEWDTRPAVGVVVASGGYPIDHESNKVISGLEEHNHLIDTKVFHSGTIKDEDNKIYTNGGRVLTVCALGDTVKQARTFAYNRINRIDFEKMYYRKDIALSAGD